MLDHHGYYVPSDYTSVAASCQTTRTPWTPPASRSWGVQTRKGDFQDVVGESEVVRTYKLSGLHLRLHRSALGRQERQPRHQL